MSSKGSIWRKWDLHAHTPLDHEWIDKKDYKDRKQDFAKEYIQFAKLQGLAVIGITDHNFCNQLEDSFLPFIIEEANKNDITILPGFEITAKDGSGIHILVLFEKDTSLTSIHKVVCAMFPFNSVLMPANGQVPVSNKSIDEIHSILVEAKLQFTMIFAHADRDNGVLEKSTITGTRRVQEWQNTKIKICQIAKSPAEYEDGFMHNVIHKKDEHYKRDIAYIIASDCRTIDASTKLEGRHYLGQKFTWIKADANLKGLNQIIYEALHRVKVQDYKPEYKEPYLTIDNVRFVFKENQENFTDQLIELNENLNTIIGGKSSGKSLLLYYIAKSIDKEQVNQKFAELKHDHYPYEKSADFDFEVKWNDGHVSKLSNGQTDRQITYIPQLYINNLAEKNGSDTLKDIIQSILNQNETFKEYYSHQLETISEHSRKLQNSIADYFQVIEIVSQKNLEYRNKGDKSAIQNSINQKNNEIDELRLRSGFDEQENDAFEMLNSTVTKVNRRIAILRELKSKFENYAKSVRGRMDSAIIAINAQMSQLESDTYLNGLKQIIENEVKQTNDFYKQLIEIAESKIAKISNLILISNKQLSALNLSLQPYMNKIVDKARLDQLVLTLKTEYSLLQDIVLIEKERKVLMKKLVLIRADIQRGYSSVHSCYKNIENQLNTIYSLISSDLKINLTAELEFNSEEFRNLFSRQINSQGYFSSKFGRYFDDANNYVYDKDKHCENIFEIFLRLHKLDNYNIKFNQSGSFDTAIKHLYRDYFHITYRLSQNGEDILRMSPGKKGLILLILLLHLSNATYPILIDQPEDNLDNRTIYKELKEFIKDKKGKRQIILVTHNANLVVTTDAENVIVANRDGEEKNRGNEKFKFEYKTGALEDSYKDNSKVGVLKCMGIKEHVCDILEGGEQAFQERENKYNLKS